MKSAFAFAALACAIPLAAEKEASTTVSILNLKTGVGHVRCALFRTAAGFSLEPNRASVRVVGTISGYTAICRFDHLNRDRIAITAFHDENDNGKHDLRFGIIPKEGIGWSQNPRVSMRAPKFEEADFYYTGTATSNNIVLNQR